MTSQGSEELAAIETMKEDNEYFADLYRKNPAFQQRLTDGTFDQLLVDIEK